MVGIHIFLELFDGGHAGRLQVGIQLGLLTGGGDHAVKILLGHGNGTADQIAEVVGKVGVEALDHVFVGDGTVGGVGHFGKHVVTNTIHAEQIGKIVGIHDVSAGFAHLVHAGKQPRMTEYLFRQGQIERHQNDGPINGMETDDILTDNMHVGRPILAVQFALRVHVVAKTCDIVGKSIHPNVDHVLIVKGDGHAPLEGGTGYAQILKTGKQEVVEHFLLAAFGLDELGIVLDILDESVGILAHLEEICLFLGAGHLTSAVGAFAINQLCFCEEGLAGYAVPALVFVFIDIALVVQLLEDVLNGLFVVGIGGTDEVIVGGIHAVPDAADVACHVVNVVLGGDPCCLCQFFDLLTVFIGTGHEENVITALTLIAGNGVGHNDFVGIADMRLTGRIGDRRCQIKLLFFHIKIPRAAKAANSNVVAYY